MSLDTMLQTAFTAVATRAKLTMTLITGSSTTTNLTGLTTTDKTSIVAAINEVKAGIGGAGATINDTTPSTTNVYSSTKTDSQITAAVNGLVAGAPAALNTLDELAAALADDASYSATVTTALGNRVRTDTAAQGLTGTQQTNARTNIGAADAAALSTLTTALGTLTTDYAAIFTAALA